MKELITIVIPCFNEKESLPELIKKIQDLTIDINFIIVDNIFLKIKEKINIDRVA